MLDMKRKREGGVLHQLREGTRAHHDRLDGLPYFLALAGGGLARASYVGHLRAMAAIHAVLESRLARSTHPAVQAVWSGQLAKLPLLLRDLEHFGPERIGDAAAATEAALGLADRVMLRSLEAPASLLGSLYVLEGSTRGSVVLRRQVAQVLAPGEAGRAYLTNYGDEVEERWKGFARQLESAPLAPEECDAAVAAAAEMYDGCAAVFAALHPLDESRLRPLVISINPEAGRHPIPQDPRELEAALRAAQQAWERLPYYEQRYGERGRRFAASDSAWLTTLAEHGIEVARQQVQWLGRLLAARGMPRLTLEEHLGLLHAALAAVAPTAAARYAVLSELAVELQQARLARVTAAQTEALEARLYAKVGGEWAGRLPRVGELIASAAADEADGLEGAVSSLERWLTDETRFPETWRAAVVQAIDEARRLVCAREGGR